MSKVDIYKCNSYDEKEVNNVINNIINSFNVIKNVGKGTKVVIKANLVSAMDPKKAATTHPTLLKCLTKYFLDKGCSVVIGDSPGGVYTKGYLNHIYSASKMDETGANLNDNISTIKTVFESAKVLKSFEYTSYLDDADLLINFCKLKTHGMMGMSCAVKNLFGTIPGTMKPEYHYRFPNHADFANMLIDLNEYFKPAINIVDAVIGMEGNGPTMGEPRHIGCVLASENPYEIDYICAKLIGLGINDVETLKQSVERGLLKEKDIILNDDVNKFLVKDFKIIKDAKSLQFFSNKKGIVFKTISKVASRIFANRPYLNNNKCIGCGKCANICPAKAITMENGKPKIDRSKCIKCYCCQEFCPIGAMTVKSSIIMRVLHFKRK